MKLNNRIGKQPVKNKVDLRERLVSALDSLKQNTNRVVSFFSMPDTQYAFGNTTIPMDRHRCHKISLAQQAAGFGPGVVEFRHGYIARSCSLTAVTDALAALMGQS